MSGNGKQSVDVLCWDRAPREGAAQNGGPWLWLHEALVKGAALDEGRDRGGVVTGYED